MHCCSREIGTSTWAHLSPPPSPAPSLLLAHINLTPSHPQIDDLLKWVAEEPLVVEVRDRDAIPDPPEFPVRSATPADGAAKVRLE